MCLVHISMNSLRQNQSKRNGKYLKLNTANFILSAYFHLYAQELTCKKLTTIATKTQKQAHVNTDNRYQLHGCPIDSHTSTQSMAPLRREVIVESCPWLSQCQRELKACLPTSHNRVYHIWLGGKSAESVSPRFVRAEDKLITSFLLLLHRHKAY